MKSSEHDFSIKNPSAIIEENCLTQKEFVKDLFDALPNALVIIDENRTVYFANKRFLQFIDEDDVSKIAGNRVGSIIGCEVALRNGDCGEATECAYCSSLNSYKAAWESKQPDTRESIVSVSDGKNVESLDLQVFSTPTTINGKDYVIFSFEDISHEKRRRILERVFFHDIINTIGGVMGFAELMNMTDDPEELDESKQLIYEYTKKLLEEVNNQKYLLAAEKNELELELREFVVQDIMKSAKNQFKNMDIAKNKQVELVLTTDLVSMTSDSAILGRIISNMLKNALEAINPGESVEMGFTKTDCKIKFYVKNPTFIPPDVQANIFRRSFSTKGANRGLGTYSMRLLGERYLQGKISFETSKETGTTFFAEFNMKLDCPN